MPRIEEIRHRAALLFLPVRRRVLAAIGWLRAKPGTRTRAALFFPLAFAVLAASVAISPKSSGAFRCGRRPVATRLARTSALARSCGPGAINPLFFGK
jgi:hypothetical protein